MPNPLFNAMQGNSNQNMLSAFGRFMNQMQGKNPNQIIQQMMQSGQINQQQLNQAQQMAQQMQSVFEPFFMH